MLYRELAPVSDDAWKEIDETAKEVLLSFLSARKVVNVNGPKGLDYNVITKGRLANIQEEGDICYGNYEIVPLTESRVEFEIDRWELDNIERGAADIQLDPLEKAVEKLALFEENAVFNGLEDAMIPGLKNSASGEEISFGDNPREMMEAISQGIFSLREAYAQGPYTLVVGKEIFERIVSKETAYALDKKIIKLIGGNILLNHVIDGAYLLPYNDDDLEFTIGRDFSIGYQSHTNDKVKFFATESFTFRVLDEDKIVKYSL